MRHATCQTVVRVVVALLLALLVSTGRSVAQHPPPPSPAVPAAALDVPPLSTELQLERDNLLLQARVAELEAQLAQLRTQLMTDRIASRAPALIQRLQASVGPEWEVHPQTLQITRKPPATDAAPPPPAAPP